MYRPEVSASEIVRKEIRRLLDSLFDGAAPELVSHLADMKALSVDDLREIEEELAARPKAARGHGGRREEGLMTALYGFWHGMIVHLWQTTIVLALILVIERMLRGAPSRVSHALWSVGLAKIFLPFSSSAACRTFCTAR